MDPLTWQVSPEMLVATAFTLLKAHIAVWAPLLPTADASEALHEQAVAAGVDILTHVYRTGDFVTKQRMMLRHYCAGAYARPVVDGAVAQGLYADIFARFQRDVIEEDPPPHLEEVADDTP